MQLTVMIPCLNEAKTLPGVIERIKKVLKKEELSAELLIVDNGSTDATAEIARTAGARVVVETVKGYGAAVRRGLAAANGEIIIYADADGSYDFGYIPVFLQEITKGADLVVGSRFHGNLHPQAMPWTHRYVGTPFLTGMINLLYGTQYLDCNGGMRAVRKQVVEGLALEASGMEMASEMLIRAKKTHLHVAHVPMDFYPDKRGGPSHLHTIRDGWRHLRLIVRERFR